MPEPTGVTLQQLSDAEEQLRGQVEPASALKSKADDEGLDMMAWGLPGLAFSPGYYQALGELRELFEMMVTGLEGHAERLKACRRDWEHVDGLMAEKFSSYDPEGLADGVNRGGSTFTGDNARYGSAGPVAVVDKDAWKSAPGGSVVNGGMDVFKKTRAVGRADNAGEMIAAVSDVSNSVMGLGGGIVGLAANPLGSLVSGGLSFLISLIQPLDDLIGMVTGNAERMSSEIGRWDGVKNELPEIGEAVAKVPEGMLGEWSGKDGHAAREKIAEFAEAVFELGDKIQVLQGLVQLCELIATLIRSSLMSLLGNWVTEQIIAWAAAGAASAFTFGGAAAAQLLNSIRSAAMTVINALNRYKVAAEAFVQGTRILQRVVQVFAVASKPLASAGFKAVGTVGNLAGAGGPSTQSIADGFDG